MINVSIIGGSGYAGGELLRLLLFHPKVNIYQATSRRFAGLPVSVCHPNLRGITDLKYTSLKDLKKTDVLFVSLPNGKSMALMNKFAKLGSKIIDLGADFRLISFKEWQKWYKTDHQSPNLINKFVYGLPELHRNQIKKAKFVAGPGCEAAVSILSLYPLIKHELIDNNKIIIDAKMGSSQAGNKSTVSSHHPERAGAVRSYSPTGHRHTAEIEQELTKVSRSNHLRGGILKTPRARVLISATAVEMVRGILVTIHTFLKKNLEEKDIWKAYRQEYKDEQFIRIVKERQGLYRYPEPKILQGTNICEIGFEKDKLGNHLVVIAAIDNLVKGTAGNAVQCMNLMMGFPETLGLEFPGLHPI